MKMATLGEVCEEVKIKAPKGNNYRVFSVTKHRGFVPSVEYFKKQVFSKDTSKYKVAHKGDIAYATIHLDEGSVGISPETCLISPMYTVFTPDAKVVDGLYLDKILRTPSAILRYQTLGRGAVERRKSIKFRDLSILKIPLPPLPEQKRIAAILDDVDESIRLRKESIKALDELIQSTFISRFGDPVTNPMGWEVGTIDDLLISANYGTSKKAHIANGEYPVLRMNNITYSGTWDFSNLKYIDLDEKDLTKHLVHNGQILFNRTNSKELVGKTAVYREAEPMAYAGYLVRGITNSNANPEYIGAYMNTLKIKEYLKNLCNNIVGMANINAKKFKNIPIPKPPIEKQNEFASFVHSIEEQKAIYTDQLKELENLFGSLQQRAFKGEL